jgi:hypothetical protein
VELPPFLAYTKEIPKNTKENMPSDHFCSHFSQEAQINLIPSPDCCIFIAFSKDTHIGNFRCHMAIFWPYVHIFIWPKWPETALIWVFPETAIKMQHCDEGIKLIGPSGKKLEQNWSD